jgi:hypothetical protein
MLAGLGCATGIDLRQLAQPGLSAAAGTDEHLRLLAGAEAYVRAVTRGTFEVYCSPWRRRALAGLIG